MPVVRPPQDDHVPPAGEMPGQSQGQVVGLAARVHEVADPESRRQGRRQPLDVPGQGVVEIAGVGVENGGLALDGGHDAGMGMPDMGNVVDRVQVHPAGVIIQVLHEPADDLEGFPVGDAQGGAEAFPADGQDLLRRPSRLSRLGWLQPENQVRVGTDRAPDVPFARPADAGIIPLFVEQVKDHLKVEMRRPTAVFRHRPHRPDPFAFFHRPAGRHPFKGRPAEVAVQRPENQRPPPGPGRVGPVFENDRRAVIQAFGVVPGEDHRSLERSEHGSPGGGEHINSEMDGPALGVRPAGRPEILRRVNDPGLAVPAEAEDGLLGFHFLG